MTSSDLSGRWIGDFFGSVRAQCFAEITAAEGATKITMHFNAGGQAQLYAGLLDVNGKTELERQVDETTLGRISLIFEQYAPLAVSGSWTDSDGNAGVFSLQKTPDKAVSRNVADPLQVIQRTSYFPRGTIYKDEVQHLIAAMKELLPTTNEVVVAATSSHSEFRRLAPDFWSSATMPTHADQLTLNLTEATGGIAKSLNLFLGQKECYFTAAGSDKIWVDGAIVGVGQMLKSQQSSVRAFYQQHGLSFNGMMLAVVLVLLPSLDLLSRALLLMATMVLAIVFFLLHRWTSKTRVYLAATREKAKHFNTVDLFTGIYVAAIIAVLGYLFGWLQHDGLARMFEYLASWYRT